MAPESSAARVRQGQQPLEEAEVTRLVIRAQAGDRDAFEVLYRKNVGRVYAICMRILADRQRAEELTQEAFIRAWTTIQSFRHESSFSSWLHRLAVNVVLVDMRALRRRNARITVAADLTPYDRGSPARPCHLTVDLEQTIAALPPQARTILILHDIEGYKHKEIAELMELAPGTCKAQLHRARRLLQEALKK